jgi:hypothetical protein
MTNAAPEIKICTGPGCLLEGMKIDCAVCRYQVERCVYDEDWLERYLASFQAALRDRGITV